MIMNNEERRKIMLQQQGSVLQYAGSSGGPAWAVEAARAMVDGHFNAMLELDTRENVARFAFALADRVAGGIPAVTDFRTLNVPAAQSVAPTEPVPVSAQRNFWLTSSYWWGFFHGSLICAFLTYWKMYP